MNKLKFAKLTGSMPRGDKSKGEQRWRPVSFIESNKLVLMRIFREKGIDLHPSAEKAVTSFPDRFLDWRDQYLTPPPS